MATVDLKETTQQSSSVPAPMPNNQEQPASLVHNDQTLLPFSYHAQTPSTASSALDSTATNDSQLIKSISRWHTQRIPQHQLDLCFTHHLMDLQHFTVRLNTNTTSVPSKIQITRHDSQFRLRLSTTRSEPVHLVTYLGPRRLHTDVFFRFRTTGSAHLEYQVIEPAGPRHFLVRLTFYPSYPPDGPVQRRAGEWVADRLWYGEKELKIYAWCGAYGEIGPLPYRVVDEPVQNVPRQGQQPPVGGAGPGNEGNGGGAIRRGDRNGGGGPTVRPAPVELPAQAPPPVLDAQTVNQLITHLCQEQAQMRNEMLNERRRHDERYDNLIFQLQVDEIGRQPPWQPQDYAHRVYPPLRRAR